MAALYQQTNEHRAAAAKATPAPVAAKATSSPAISKPTPPRRLAAEETYLLLRYCTVITSTGIIGGSPDTTVTLIKRDGASVEVADQEHRVFQMDASLVTNDIDLAIAAARDTAIQRGVETHIAEEIRRHDQQENYAARVEEQNRIKGNKPLASRG